MKNTHRAILIALAIALSASLILIFAAENMTESLRDRREQACYNAVLRAAAEFDVPVPLILAVIRTESDFRPNAVSAAGAIGLMQLLPGTFRYLTTERLAEDLEDTAIYTPDINIRYGTYYLSYLYERFEDWPTALAAYNAGEGRVAEWLSDPTLSPAGHLKSIPFSETAQYVQDTMQRYALYCEKYNFRS